MSRFLKFLSNRLVFIPDGNDQPLTSEIDGQRFLVGRGDASSVEGAPVLTIDNDDVTLLNAGELATQGDTATVEVNGEDARILNLRGAAIEAEETAIQVNGEDATILNSGTITGGFNGISFAAEGADSGRIINRGVITSDSRGVDIDGEDVTLLNRGKILGTGDQRNGTVYTDNTADDYQIVNSGLIDAGAGNQGAGISLELGEEVDAEVFNSGSIQGRGNAAASSPLAGDGIRLASGVEGPSAFTGDITNRGTITSEGANGTVAGIRVANGVGFEGTLSNSSRGVVSGVQNGVYFGNADHNGGDFVNRGLVTSDSRAVNLDGDELTFVNRGRVLGTDDQRNGTTYIDGTGDDITVENRGRIDAGEGNLGDGISVQVGAAAEDATNENIVIENSGTIQGRGQAEFDGGRLASNGSSGLRFFNGSGEAEATVTGRVVNSGTISAEVDVGFLGGLVVEDGVAFDGEIVNGSRGVISGPRNGLYIGNAEHDLTIENEGRIESGSRAVNLDGDNVSFRNEGEVVGIGDQRNGTLYLDGTADDIGVENEGRIDAGRGNDGSGVSVQVGAAAEDALNENITVTNDGLIQGRGDGNVPAGLRFFNGSGEEVATVTGSVSNGDDGRIASETEAGILIEEGVAFVGSITNEGVVEGGNGIAIDAAGSQGDITLNQNDGVLRGDVLLGSGNDVVSVDGGVVKGDLDTGAGDDIVSVGEDGRVEGEINGGSGSDSLTAGEDGSVLNGGADNDFLTGGEGADSFVLEQGTGQDRVAQFDAQDDVLDLSDFGFANLGEVQAAAEEVEVDGELATVIDLDGAAGADQVTLLGVAVTDLNDGNVALGEDPSGV